MKSWKRFWISALSVGIGLSVFATYAEEISVITTFVPVYSWAKGAAGESANVENLLDGAVGPHEFQLTPGNVRKLNSADLIICIGLDLEPWLEAMEAQGALKKEVKLLKLGEKLDKDELIKYCESIEEEHAHSGEAEAQNDREEDHSHTHSHGEYDPHIWLDPILAQKCTELIAEELGLLKPEKNDNFKKNAQEYCKRLEALDKELQEGLKNVKDKSFYTMHNAFAYFNKRYGLKCAGVLQEVPDTNVSPRHLSELLKKIESERVSAILVPSADERNRMVRQMARDGGLEIGILETLETLDDGALNVEAYERMIRSNLKVLQRVLQ